MATFVFTVTCLLCFFTCCLSVQTSDVSCSVQNNKVCNIDVNPTLTDSEKKLCIYLNYYVQLLCHKIGYIPLFLKNSSLSTVELCKQIIEINNISRIDNSFLGSCISTCDTSSFMPVCLYMKKVINALINTKTQSTVEKSPPPENKKVSTTKSMPTVTTSTNKRLNLPKFKNSKQLNTSSSITTVSIKSEINTNTSNASSDNSKLKSVSTSDLLKKTNDINPGNSVLNNVLKKTNDINPGNSVLNNVLKKTTNTNLGNSVLNNVLKKTNDTNLGNSVLNNVLKKTTNTNLGNSVLNNELKKTNDINLGNSVLNNELKKTNDINLGNSVLNNELKKTNDTNLGNSVVGRQDDFDFNHQEMSKSFHAQKEIPNHFPTSSKDEQQKSFDVTNDRNAKQKTLLPGEYNETPSSAHFMGYFLTAIVLCIAGYIVFHNKQKIIAFIIEGRNQKRSRRPNSGEYKKLQTNVDDVMSSLEKSTASQNYIY